MANFNNLSLTSSGVKALLEAQTGKTLTLSKIGLGSGSTTSGITSLKALVTPELMLPISEYNIDSDQGYMTVIAKMTNEGMTEGFYWKETGLFFKDESDNDVLFAYACITDDKYDYIPAYSDQRYVKNIRIANIVADTDNITIEEYEGLLYVDTVTFNAYKAEVAADIDNITFSVKAEGTAIEADDSAEDPFLGMRIFGKTNQISTTETPDPDNPQELVSVARNGNLLPYPYLIENSTVLGVTFTANSDGSIKISGTNSSTTSAVSFTLKDANTVVLEPNKEYRFLTLSSSDVNFVAGGSESGVTYTQGKDFCLTTNAEGKFGYCMLQVPAGATVNATIYPMIIESDSGITEYRPYSGKLEVGVKVYGENESDNPQSIVIKTANGLPGIPVTDASLANYTDENGQMWCCDEVDLDRGVYVQRVKTKRITSDLTFSRVDSWKAGSFYVSGFFIDGIEVSGYDEIANIICTHAVAKEASKINTETNFVGQGNSYHLYISFKEFSLSELTDFLSNNEVYVQYILATPIATALTAEEIAAYKALRTKNPITTIMNDCGAYMEVAYCKATASGESIGRIKDGVNDSVKYGDVVDNLLSTSTDIPLSANQGRVLQDHVDELNTDLEWKELGTVQGKDTVLTFPSDFKELSVSTWVVYNNLERAFTARFLKDQLENSLCVYTLAGYYLSSSDWGYSAIDISKTQASIRGFFYAGQNLNSEAKMKIRYR